MKKQDLDDKSSAFFDWNFAQFFKSWKIILAVKNFNNFSNQKKQMPTESFKIWDNLNCVMNKLPWLLFLEFFAHKYVLRMLSLVISFKTSTEETKHSSCLYDILFLEYYVPKAALLVFFTINKTQFRFSRNLITSGPKMLSFSF